MRVDRVEVCRRWEELRFCHVGCAESLKCRKAGVYVDKMWRGVLKQQVKSQLEYATL